MSFIEKTRLCHVAILYTSLFTGNGIANNEKKKKKHIQLAESVNYIYTSLFIRNTDSNKQR